MKRLPVFALLILAAAGSACTRTSAEQERMDELVLIEFASRLEEDYHRLHPRPVPAPAADSDSAQ